MEPRILRLVAIGSEPSRLLQMTDRNFQAVKLLSSYPSVPTLLKFLWRGLAITRHGVG
jgi:hypothetical protein